MEERQQQQRRISQQQPQPQQQLYNPANEFYYTNYQQQQSQDDDEMEEEEEEEEGEEEEGEEEENEDTESEEEGEEEEEANTNSPSPRGHFSPVRTANNENRQSLTGVKAKYEDSVPHQKMATAESEKRDAEDYVQRLQEALEQAQINLELGKQCLKDAEDHVQKVNQESVQELLQAEAKRGWVKRYQQLKAFYDKHGHSRVKGGKRAHKIEAIKGNQELEELHEMHILKEWCEYQRRNKKTLDKWEMLALEELKFDWTPIKEEIWQDNFQELKAFHEKNGNLKGIPGELGQWFKVQCMAYDTYVEDGNKDTVHMNAGRVKQLNELDPDWRSYLVIQKRAKKLDLDWETAFSEANILYNKHEHLVWAEMKDENEELLEKMRLFEQQQRRQLHNKQKGFKTTMTDERLHLLNSIHFFEDTKDRYWRLNVRRIKDFAAYHDGSCNILPERFYTGNEDWQKLARWAQKTRSDYKKFLSNPSSSNLTDEKVQQLTALGFQFEVAPILSSITSEKKARENEIQKADPASFVNQRVAKRFGDQDVFFGTVKSFVPQTAPGAGDQLWRITYDDNDEEEYHAAELDAGIHLYKQYRKFEDPSIFVNRRVAKFFGDDLFFGTVKNFIPFKDAGVQLWHIEFDDNDEEDCNQQELEAALRLYRTYKDFEDPKAFVGQRVARYFGGVVFYGTITKHSPATDEEVQLWRVEYDDGDKEDSDLKELEHCLFVYRQNEGEDPGPPPPPAEPAAAAAEGAEGEGGTSAAVVATAEGEKQILDPKNKPFSVMDQRVAKYFGDDLYLGSVSSFVPPVVTAGNVPLWRIQYDDGDVEDLNVEDLEKAMEMFRKYTEEKNQPKTTKTKQAGKPAAPGTGKARSGRKEAKKTRTKPSQRKTNPYAFISARVSKCFGDDVVSGTVKSFVHESKRWRVVYDDGDESDYDLEEVEKASRVYRMYKQLREDTEGSNSAGAAAASAAPASVRQLPKRRAAKVAKKAGRAEEPQTAQRKTDPRSFIGKRVAKRFKRELYYGTVKSYAPQTRAGGQLWHVKYDDEDEEDFDWKDLQEGLRVYEGSQASDGKANGTAAAEAAAEPATSSKRAARRNLPVKTKSSLKGRSSRSSRADVPTYEESDEEDQTSPRKGRGKKKIDTVDWTPDEYMEEDDDGAPNKKGSGRRARRSISKRVSARVYTEGGSEQEEKFDPHSLVNQRVARDFGGDIYFGSVTSYGSGLWHVKYDDEDEEDLDEKEIHEAMDIYEENKEADGGKGAKKRKIGAPEAKEGKNGEKAKPQKETPTTTTEPRVPKPQKKTPPTTEPRVPKKPKTNPESYVNRRVAKYFGDQLYFGTVKSFGPETRFGDQIWHVKYDDSDKEDYDADDLDDGLRLYRQKRRADKPKEEIRADQSLPNKKRRRSGGGKATANMDMSVSEGEKIVTAAEPSASEPATAAEKSVPEGDKTETVVEPSASEPATAAEKSAPEGDKTETAVETSASEPAIAAEKSAPERDKTETAVETSASEPAGTDAETENKPSKPAPDSTDVIMEGVQDTTEQRVQATTTDVADEEKKANSTDPGPSSSDKKAEEPQPSTPENEAATDENTTTEAATPPDTCEDSKEPAVTAAGGTGPDEEFLEPATLDPVVAPPPAGDISVAQEGVPDLEPNTSGADDPAKDGIVGGATEDEEDPAADISGTDGTKENALNDNTILNGNEEKVTIANSANAGGAEETTGGDAATHEEGTMLNGNEEKATIANSANAGGAEETTGGDAAAPEEGTILNGNEEKATIANSANAGGAEETTGGDAATPKEGTAANSSGFHGAKEKATNENDNIDDAEEKITAADNTSPGGAEETTGGDAATPEEGPAANRSDPPKDDEAKTTTDG